MGNLFITHNVPEVLMTAVCPLDILNCIVFEVSKIIALKYAIH